jgi:hypothetical protein
MAAAPRSIAIAPMTCTQVGNRKAVGESRSEATTSVGLTRFELRQFCFDSIDDFGFVLPEIQS